MEIEFPDDIRRAGDALRYACDRLYESGVHNFIHYNDVVTVEINGVDYYPVIDYSRYVVVFDL